MPQLVFRAAARREIAEIAAYIQKEAKNRAVADSFIARLVSHCARLASLPSLIGRARPELGKNYRSVVFGNYVIFIRYGDDEGPRSHLYVVHVVHGARDLDTYFSQHPD